MSLLKERQSALYYNSRHSIYISERILLFAFPSFSRHVCFDRLGYRSLISESLFPHTFTMTAKFSGIGTKQKCTVKVVRGHVVAVKPIVP